MQCRRIGAKVKRDESSSKKKPLLVAIFPNGIPGLNISEIEVETICSEPEVLIMDDENTTCTELPIDTLWFDEVLDFTSADPTYIIEVVGQVEVCGNWHKDNQMHYSKSYRVK